MPTTTTSQPFAQLYDLARRMPDRLTDADQDHLHQLYYESLEQLDDPEMMFTYIVVNAMRKQLAGAQSTEHIYVKQFEIPQIRLFELLIQQFPLATLSQHCMNTLLIEALAQHTNPVLMDIGIGTGVQVATIIQGLAQRPDSRIRQLTVVGIEPFAEAINAAKQTIEGVSKLAPFHVSFVSRVAFIEQLLLTDLVSLLPAFHDGIYVNASFALHHIQQAAQRRAVFSRLKKLGVQALIVSEPNSDHYEADYGKRFQSCVHHYGAVCRMIDLLTISMTEKAALKLFFSREIDDVLGHTEAVRVEKHYSTEQWMQALTETGFQLRKNSATFAYTEVNSAYLETNLPDRYATVFEGEEITSLFWAA